MRAFHEGSTGSESGQASSGKIEIELAYTQLLIDFLRPFGASRTGNIEYLLKRLEDLINGHVAVIRADGSVLGSRVVSRWTEGTSPTLPVSRVSKGSLGAAAARHGGYYVQLVGIGKNVPRSVLAVARRTPFPTRVASLIGRTVTTLAFSEFLSRTESIENKLNVALVGAKSAIQARLLAGDIEGSRKLADPLMPGLFEATHAEVYVVEAPARRRDEVVALCENMFKNTALVIPGEVETQFTLIAPVTDSPPPQTVRAKLKSIVLSHGSYAGGSRAFPIDRMKEAHSVASRALPVARRLPERLAVHSGTVRLAHVLDRRAAGWAQGLLEPIMRLPEEQRVDLTDAVVCSLQYGHSGAARRLGANRKTISSKWKKAESLLRLDLEVMRNRALLDLSLNLVQPTIDSPGPEPHLSFSELLLLPEALAWAQELVAPLKRDGRSLTKTARTWIECNGNVADCARILDSHANTVRNHLAACEELLSRRLMCCGGGASDLVNAFQILDASREQASITERFQCDA